MIPVLIAAGCVVAALVIAALVAGVCYVLGLMNAIDSDWEQPL